MDDVRIQRDQDDLGRPTLHTRSLASRIPRERPVFWFWVAVSVCLVAIMGVLRLMIFGERVVPLSYGLALLIALGHRNLRLLYGMGLLFTVMAALKAFILIPEQAHPPLDDWIIFAMQMANIWVVVAVLHLVLRMTRRLERKRRQLELLNARLHAVNEKLITQHQEISSQNQVLRAQARELEQQGAELDSRRISAEELSRQTTRFLAAVSHDVRTPANAIGLLAELIEDAAAGPSRNSDLPQLIGDMKSNARALVDLVGDVLDLARLDCGRLDLQPSTFNLRDMIACEIRQHQLAASAKNLHLTHTIACDGVWARTDKMKLARVVSNLVGNAIKFTESGGVQVTCDNAPDGSVVIAVADTGVGIPSDHLGRIFDEFHQLGNPERDRTKGTGLGLAICRRLVDALGCAIAVESVVHRGTTFRITLPPHVIVPPPHRAAPAADQGQAPADPRPLEQLRILLVEDHDITRIAAARLLKARGAVVFEAPSGRAAIHILAHEQPHVILLDLMLPDIDGTEVLRHLRRQRPQSLRSILVISGDVRPSREAEVKALGADGLVPKPLRIDPLIQRLSTIARDPNPDAGADAAEIHAAT